MNWAHLCLGELVRLGYIHTVLTTNFDQLVLEGILRTSVRPVIADGIESLNRISGRPNTPQVVHLHGSMQTYSPRNSRTAVVETRSNLAFQGTLYGLLRDAHLLVVVGYAGGEEGVMQLLIEAAARLPEMVVYWCIRARPFRRMQSCSRISSAADHTNSSSPTVTRIGSSLTSWRVWGSVPTVDAGSGSAPKWTGGLYRRDNE